jgi:hypothetical protein
MLASWPGLSRPSTPSRFRAGPMSARPRAKSVRNRDFCPSIRFGPFVGSNRVDGRDKPGHDNLSVRRRNTDARRKGRLLTRYWLRSCLDLSLSSCQRISAEASGWGRGNDAQMVDRAWRGSSFCSPNLRQGLAGRDAAGPADPVHLRLWLADQFNVPQLDSGQDRSRDPRAGVGRVRLYPGLGRSFLVRIHLPWPSQTPRRRKRLDDQWRALPCRGRRHRQVRHPRARP